ncbi:epididymal secretory protein E3-beta-like [Ursus americanus]|uniref:epididymal secretory protein E3-beta-like n=1 Tax=Ursus americanus TaxID=9643 RepID=UPI001E67931C|nr:epididymal secretory protein E3-beta-like [Ursus americanus]XP_045640870.1 epididymal secretory protein E3-beta-like [Ursus americanus]XP_045640875.1 epididymal secretory protein E3-beta-like [Ursus americanus]XP_048081197.2 epididymal secretory protein E3-beta-like [Ursus arctos]
MLSSLFPVAPQLALLTQMASSLKVLGPLLALLVPLGGLLVRSHSPSWREFRTQHYLSASWKFSDYKCDELMREREAPQDRDHHVFIYTSWHKIEQICLRKWRDRSRNVYVWAQHPFRILRCYQEGNGKSYRGHGSYSYVEFHCGGDGHVDGIEDIQVLDIKT